MERRSSSRPQEASAAASPAAAPSVLFSLDQAFIAQMQGLADPWSTRGQEDVLAALVYYRTYSRGGQPWWKCCQRVVEGTFRIQQQHFANLHKLWDFDLSQEMAQEMYRRIFSMKFLPPGRGLWAMGTRIVEEKGLVAALNNCAYVTTSNIGKGPEEFCSPFLFLMDASMLGVGVGTDTKGAGSVTLFHPKDDKDDEDDEDDKDDEDNGSSSSGVRSSEPPSSSFNRFVVPDTREGWVESVRALLLSYCQPNQSVVHFDYSHIRNEGTPLQTFGGVSAGSGPLEKLHEELRGTLGRKYEANKLDSRGIADICNQIGVAVVSGNIRRTAEILFGDPGDPQFLDLKNYEKNPERCSYGWTSNNSIYAYLGMDYSEAAERIRTNGEPGFIWLENARRYSRMKEDEMDFKDGRVQGANPCVEMSLEDGEMCNLVETFLCQHETLEDYQETLRYAYMYAKTVTLLPSHWTKTNDVQLRNRRIGVSQSGLQQFVARESLDVLMRWCDSSYEYLQFLDKEFSEKFATPRSIKLTTIKPSGTVSLLAGATPGMHWPISTYYIRRVTLSRLSPYVSKLRNAGYTIETSVYDPENSVVVELPVFVGDEKMKCQKEVSMWEQFEFAAFMQKHWADNQVSSTITFDKEKEGSQIEAALNYYQYHLKGISLLPSSETGERVYKIIWNHGSSSSRSDDDVTPPGAVRRTIIDEGFVMKLLSSSIVARCTTPHEDEAAEKDDDRRSGSLSIRFQRYVSTEMIETFCLPRIMDALALESFHHCKIESKVETPYKQMPYESITKATYLELVKNILPVQWEEKRDQRKGGGVVDCKEKEVVDAQSLPKELMYCDGDSCMI